MDSSVISNGEPPYREAKYKPIESWANEGVTNNKVRAMREESFFIRYSYGGDNVLDLEKLRKIF
jgi:hypothetical protein